MTRVLKALAIIVLAGILGMAALSFLGHVPTVVTILIGSIIFAYLIYPAVRRLNERLPLGASIAVVYCALALMVAFAASVIVPALSANIKEFGAGAPAIVKSAQQSLADPRNPVVRRLPPAARDYIAQLPANIAALLTQYGAGTASKTLGILLSTVSFAALFIVIPVLAAYMLMEAATLKRTVIGMLPVRARPKTVKILGELDAVIGGFIRGQILVALIVGALVTALLLILHVRYAVLIGVIAGVLDVFPYVGAVAGWLPAFIIAMFTNGWQNAVWVTVGIIAINQLEGNVIAPNVVSRSVELTPLAVVVALLTGAELLGVAGLLLAVPIAGIIRVLILNFRPPEGSAMQPEPPVVAITTAGGVR